MTRLPDIVIIVDQQEEYAALRECITLECMQAWFHHLIVKCMYYVAQWPLVYQIIFFQLYKSLGGVVGEPFWVLLFIAYDLNVVIVTSLIVVSLRVNFAWNLPFQKLLMLFIWAWILEPKFGEIQPNPWVDFLGSSVSCWKCFKVILGTLSTLEC